MKGETIIRLVYIGPTFRRAMLKTGTVFKGGTPETFNSLMDQIPGLRDLFVTSDRLPAARVSVKQRGSRYQVIFEAVQKWIKEDAIARHKAAVKEIEEGAAY